MHIINRETVDCYAYSNSELCTKPIKGIVLEFHGLGYGDLIHGHNERSRMFAQNGVLYVFPYYGPWSWMNRNAVAIVDAVTDAFFDRFSLAPNTPIIASGGSMGGLSSLIYTRYAKRTPTACAANCPVCDLPFHRTERDDLPRTVYSAFCDYPMPFDDAVKTASPVHQAADMPKIPYLIVHCEEDKAVNKAKHSDVLVEALRKSGHEVEYIAVPGRGHCDMDEAAWKRYDGFILENIK